MNADLAVCSKDLDAIPSTTKRRIGIDGSKNEYYYYQDLGSKIYVKRINGSWYELSEEDITELLSCLSDKGINERSLITKVQSILTQHTMDIDSINPSTWVNIAVEPIRITQDRYSHLVCLLINLEEKITEVLYHEGKEWDSKSNRLQWVII
jgi:hypothetical protein